MRFVDIKVTHLQEVVDNCGMAYPTRKLIKTFLNVLYRFAIKNDIVQKRYSEFINIGRNEGKSKRKPFTENEIQTLWENVDKLEFVDTILILIYTGLRISELLSITTDNVFIDKRYMVRRNEDRSGT